MATYSKQEIGDEINWKTRLEEIIKCKETFPFSQITEEENRELIFLSGQWVTCACGNQCSIIPRGKSGAPIDTKLKHYGILFHNFIETSEWEEALNVLRVIEQRSEILIHEQTENNSKLSAPILFG